MINYTFKRYEVKFLLSPLQFENIKNELFDKVFLDEYGETTIQSLYYDTPSNFLIRRSIEKPLFKEKLRLRSYGLAKPDSKLYLEIKRKYEGVVYKRRISLKQNEADDYIKGNKKPDSQIAKEISYFKKHYEGLRPDMLIIYDRMAYSDLSGNLRITLDRNIRYRKDNLDLSYSLDGTKIIPDGYILMEVKVPGAYPMWLTRLLNENKIYKISFSKYGEAYQIEEKKKIKEKKETLTWMDYSKQYLRMTQ